jgi:hypothetical protein
MIIPITAANTNRPYVRRSASRSMQYRTAGAMQATVTCAKCSQAMRNPLSPNETLPITLASIEYRRPRQ